MCRVAASPGSRGVGTPAAISQLEPHAVCRAALAAPCLMGQGFMWPGCPAQLGVMFSPSQRWAAWWLRCYRPHRGGRLIGLTRRALPRRRHLAAPSLTPCTHFGDWRRFPAPRAVDHCVRLLLCSMWEGDVLGGQGATPAGATACSRCALSAVIENGVGTSTKGTPLTVRVRRCRVSRCRLAACLALHLYRLQRDWLPRRRPSHHPQFLRNLPVCADPLHLSPLCGGDG